MALDVKIPTVTALSFEEFAMNTASQMPKLIPYHLTPALLPHEHTLGRMERQACRICAERKADHTPGAFWVVSVALGPGTVKFSA